MITKELEAVSNKLAESNLLVGKDSLFEPLRTGPDPLFLEGYLVKAVRQLSGLEESVTF